MKLKTDDTSLITTQQPDAPTPETPDAAQSPRRSLWKTWIADLLLFCFTGIYVELCLHLCVYHKLDRHTIYLILFALQAGVFFSLLTSFLPKILRQTVGVLLVAVQVLFAEVQLVYQCIFGNFMPISQVSMGENVITNFNSQIFYAIFKNLPRIILLLLPLIAVIACLALRKVPTLKLRLRWKQAQASFALLLVLSALAVSFALPPKAAQTSGAAAVGNTVWVIDAGHGGEDGGAVGADGSRESDINLAIARRLEGLLILLGEETRMTRTDDRSIHSEGASTLREKKRSDLKNRVALVNGTQGAILVSIHQNSLPSSKRTHGAQVFYGIEEGSAALANAVQRLLNETVNLENQKAEKSIDPSIYLMKNVTAPAILIECGFLSNENETALLKSADYQQKLAVVIATGLLRPAQ